MSSREMDQLRAEVDQLRKEVKIKDNEISSLVEENEDLKDTLKILDEAKAESKDGKTISADKKMEVELKIREKENRELKDKLGVLRKEKIQKRRLGKIPNPQLQYMR
jgi:prefoldin subunit 5